MTSETAIVIALAAAIIGGSYAYKQYQAGQAKKQAAQEWDSALKLGTLALGL